MTIVERIKALCKEQKITLAELERKTKLSNGTIRRWNEKTPGIDKLLAVADYFQVKTDYLLGRTDNKYWKQERRDVALETEQIINRLETDVDLEFYGEPMSTEDKEKFAIALKVALEISKQEAKMKLSL